MNVRYDFITSKGGRGQNEDAIRIESCQGRYLFALADGLGSCGNGRIASDTAVNASAACFLSAADSPGILPEAIRKAQEEVLKKQEDDRSLAAMSTTLAVLYLGEKSAAWAHIGDSRVYYFENGHLKDCTKDHSVPQLLVNLGEIRQDEVRGHPQQNRLLKVIGGEWTSNPFSVSEQYTLKGSESFLLCSDGFWEYIDESRMEECLISSASPEEWLRRMDEIAREQASGTQRDNYSAICIMVS